MVDYRGTTLAMGIVAIRFPPVVNTERKYREVIAIS